MSILDNITAEEIETAVRESPIIRAAVMAERERCAVIAESIIGNRVYPVDAHKAAREIADKIRGKK